MVDGGLLGTGQRVRVLGSDTDAEVRRLLGSGAQGEVYEVHTDDGNRLALKWFFPEQATNEQFRILSDLVRRGAPDRRFLWPQDLARSTDAPGFGYLMAIRESRYASIVDLMTRRADPSFRTLVIAGCHLADGFWRLHANGLCYRDINFGNVFFDPDSGNVAICDNDNVGVADEVGASVAGTIGFMAPEIVRGDPGAAPNRGTDLFSLAVLLFYMLMVHHPLEGERESNIRALDLNARRKLYGHEPVFIWDPDDQSNRPVRGFHDNALDFWPVYPGFIQDLFTQSFTVGLRDPRQRVGETQWRKALARLHDLVQYCDSCQAAGFLDPDAAGDTTCWSCGKPVRRPPRLQLRQQGVLLTSDAKLYPHHLESDEYFTEPVAELARHPSDPGRWGLRNQSSDKWVAQWPNGQVREVEPGRSVPLMQGIRIQFGAVEGQIQA
jgi:eukaryotic-like serine/threonine-protein kinase